MKVYEFANTTPHNEEPFADITVQAIYAGPCRNTVTKCYSVTELDLESFENIIDDIYEARTPGYSMSEIAITQVVTYREGIMSNTVRYDNANLSNKTNAIRFFKKHCALLRRGKREKREA